MSALLKSFVGAHSQCSLSPPGWSKQLQMEIGNLRSIELEALQEKYYLTKKTRIELFGQKLQDIRDELDKRNLPDVPTAKLLDLLERFGRILKEEAVPVTFVQETGMEDLFQAMGKTTETWQG